MIDMANPNFGLSGAGGNIQRPKLGIYNSPVSASQKRGASASASASAIADWLIVTAVGL